MAMKEKTSRAAKRDLRVDMDNGQNSIGPRERRNHALRP
jgi:hypothetical protein